MRTNLRLGLHRMRSTLRRYKWARPQSAATSERTKPRDERGKVVRKRQREAHRFTGRRMREGKLVRVQRLPHVAQRASLALGEEGIELSARCRRSAALRQL